MKISIITVVFNDHDGVLNTINSVTLFAQKTCHDVEYIVIDGDSQDGTKSVISAVDITPFSKYVSLSEKDDGIYDAMNKGVRQMSEDSDYCVFMNAGDTFNSNAAKVIDKHRFFNDIEVFGIVSILGDTEVKNRKIIDKHCLRLWPAYPHQATFISSRLHRNRMYDLNFKVLADYDFFADVYQKGAKIGIHQENISFFVQGGASNRLDTMSQTIKEMIYIQNHYFDKVNYKLVLSLAFKVFLRTLPFSNKIEPYIRLKIFGEN